VTIAAMHEVGWVEGVFVEASPNSQPS